MSAPAIGSLGILCLFVLMFVRVPVWAALSLVGFGGIAALSGWRSAWAVFGTVPFDTGSSYTLSVIPLFVLMGEVASSTRLSGDLFIAAQKMLAGVRGGLAYAAIAASACFGAVCGSSIATAATMSRIALPEMRKANYDDGLSTGALAAGGSLGILIPPSIILVIYAAIAEQSVPKLFAAALLPGLVLTALYMACAFAMIRWNPSLAPPPMPNTLREKLAALREPWQFIALFVVSVGGIYAGIFSPTEAAAVGAFGAIALGLLGRRVTRRQLMKSLESTVLTSGLLLIIVIGATVFSMFIVQTHLPDLMIKYAGDWALPGGLVMALIILAYVVMGCFLEGIAWC